MAETPTSTVEKGAESISQSAQIELLTNVIFRETPGGDEVEGKRLLVAGKNQETIVDLGEQQDSIGYTYNKVRVGDREGWIALRSTDGKSEFARTEKETIRQAVAAEEDELGESIDADHFGFTLDRSLMNEVFGEQGAASIIGKRRGVDLRKEVITKIDSAIDAAGEDEAKVAKLRELASQLLAIDMNIPSFQEALEYQQKNSGRIASTFAEGVGMNDAETNALTQTHIEQVKNTFDRMNEGKTSADERMTFDAYRAFLASPNTTLFVDRTDHGANFTEGLGMEGGFDIDGQALSTINQKRLDDMVGEGLLAKVEITDNGVAQKYIEQVANSGKYEAGTTFKAYLTYVPQCVNQTIVVEAVPPAAAEEEEQGGQENVCETGSVQIHALNVDLQYLYKKLAAGESLTKNDFFAADKPLRGNISAHVKNEDANWFERGIGADKKVAEGFTQHITRQDGELSGYVEHSGSLENEDNSFDHVAEASVKNGQDVYLKMPGVVINGHGGNEYLPAVHKAFTELFAGHTAIHEHYQVAGNARKPVSLPAGCDADQYVLVVPTEDASSDDADGGGCNCSVQGTSGQAAGAGSGVL